jgi:hypothetical protein
MAEENITIPDGADLKGILQALIDRLVSSRAISRTYNE